MCMWFFAEKKKKKTIFRTRLIAIPKEKEILISVCCGCGAVVNVESTILCNIFLSKCMNINPKLKVYSWEIIGQESDFTKAANKKTVL